MFAEMTSDHPETTLGKAIQPEFHKVSENLYRLETTGGYYGLLKRGGKQFRRSLNTKDRKLAERKLAQFRKDVHNLKVTENSRLDFDAVAKLWLNTIRHAMKPSSAKRRETCLKALGPFFKGVLIRNISRRHCERWLTERGATIAPQTFAHELDTLKAVLEYGLEHGLILENPARRIKRRRIVQARVVIPSRNEFQRLIASIRQSDGRSDSQA
ncbi:MAG: hypothetical protein FJ405_02690, partial [Verrucomicrobia bacterium]|nr:hypothetical protein [Verrucomicrobiota bacterium]